MNRKFAQVFVLLFAICGVVVQTSNSGVLMHTEDQRTNEVVDYINLEGQLIAERAAPIGGGAVTTRYQHADLRNGPTVVSSAGGAQVERSIEQPFGAPYSGIYRDGPGFTGHATDAASGLSYMQQRYYDPIAMRFLSVDPAAPNPGLAFTRYAYAANNPYKYVDPDGQFVVAIPAAIEASAVACAASGLCVAAVTTTAVVATGVAVNNIQTESKGSPFSRSTYLSESTNAPESGETPVDEPSSESGPKTLKPGPFAGDSIPARGPARDFTPEEREAVNEIGRETGCHTCGTKDPGTKTGNFIPDHQPPNALNPDGGAQELYPHCLTCSRTQGGEVRQNKPKN